MNRFLAVAIGALPIVTLSLLPQLASAEAVPQKALSSAPVMLADRYDDANQRRDDWRDNNQRRDDWRDNNQRRYDHQRCDHDWRYSNRRDSQRQVWIPGHWERGFLGIGRKWVAGHYEKR